jgi:hypothetical protein
MKSDKLIATSFSENGSKSLAKLLTKKYGCTIIKESTYDKDRGMWMLTYIDPFLEIINEVQSSKNERTRGSTRQSKNKRALRSSMG